MEPVIAAGRKVNILALNAGSSSLKFGLFRRSSQGALDTLMAGEVEDIAGSSGAVLRVKEPAARVSTIKSGRISMKEGVRSILNDLAPGDAPGCIGCRVVHGGGYYNSAAAVSPEVIVHIRDAARYAPLHNPVDLEVIEAARLALPDAPVAAVFDTAFHRTIPEVARAYGLPRDLSARHGLVRYGFHGIAHRAVSERLTQLLDAGQAGRLVTCHLGSGASICAV
ncbi:MAG TPA: hypothetical protein VGS41_10405, partial [Chthonomonadales bacterium]|nr:hypothetical protein [Chthonomonadales bacterium]